MVSGCGMTSQQKVDAAKEALPAVQQAVLVLDQQITKAQSSLAVLTEQLSDPNLTGEIADQIRSAAEKGSEELARLQKLRGPVFEALTQISAVVAAGPTTGASVTDLLKMAQGSLAAVAGVVPGPAGAWLQIAAGVIAFLITLLTGGGVVAAKKLQTVKTAFTEVVAGGEAFKADLGTGSTAIDVFKGAQARLQRTPATKRLVAVTRADLKAS
jgi:hypothetical protein